MQSGRLLELFRDRGLTHDASVFFPGHSGIPPRPWTDWFGIVRVPYYWEDDFGCDSSAEPAFAELLAREGMKGFDFHPIHVFLNTERLERYERARPNFRDIAKLKAEKNAAFGTRTLLAELCGLGLDQAE